MLHDIELKVLTPVHVGMGMEKKLYSGLDFYFDQHRNGENEGAYIVVDQRTVFNSLDQQTRDRVTQYLITGNFNGFEKFLKDAVKRNDSIIRYEWATLSDNAQEIRMAFQDGFGKYYIPGSSIKGALRSIILKNLWNGRNGDINEQRLLGGIEDNLMRFLQVTDCCVDQNPGIYPVKVFAANIQNNGFGMWKNASQGNHLQEFNPRQFVSFYEMFSDGVNSEDTIGTFRINWGLSNTLRAFRNQTPNINMFDNDISIFFKQIRKHTDDFLRREKKYFETYSNPDIDDSFFDELEWLREQNLENENSCVLRLGANVGWHSITGDWKYASNDNSHVDSVRERWNLRDGGRQNATKTRKIGFDLQEDDNVRFFLPGFVKLTLK